MKVLLADDQPLVRDGLRAILEAHPDIVVSAEASTGRDAIEMCARHVVDLVLMDIRMPEVDGLEACRQIAGRPGGPRVLILTTYDLDEYVYEALRAGASGFVLKDAPRDRLVAAVRAVGEGETLLAPAITRRLVETFVRHPPPTSRPLAALEDLTDREREILELIVRGLSNRRSPRGCSSPSRP